MAKIGVFDSGVGGLTVLKELAQTFPSENFLYLGDTARLPYGTKSPETIRKYSEQIMDFLIEQKVDALIIACNTASSQVPETEWKKTPVFNVIEPGAAQAVKISESQRIGILGTRATVASQSYTFSIKALSDHAQIFSQACPLFVPLAEEGWTDDPITNLIAFRYLQPLLANQVDTVVLGCTHYPLLRTAIQKACGNSVNLVDSGSALCEKLNEAFHSGLLKKSTGEGSITFMATDLSPHTRALAERVLEPLHVGQFEVVNL